jgi:sterol desaturase/sphingolipid hydroxylase (fatty acid hydroxylase superfamily)
MFGEALEAIPHWLSSNTDIAWFLGYWIFLALLAGFETIIPAFHQPAQRQLRWPTNIGLGIVNMMLATLVPVSAVWGARWAENKGIGLLNAMNVSWWVAVIITFAVASLAGFAVHMLTHKAPLLWRLHRIHHSDTHLDVSTTLRSHPAEVVLLFFTTVPLAIVFGLDARALAAYEGIHGIIGLVSHANLRLPERLDRSLRWLFVTPNMHCLHHSSYQPETDSNYGQVFSVWDRLFGTYSAAPKAGYDAMQFGLEEIRDGRASDIVWQLKSPALRIERMTQSRPNY